MIPRMRSSPLVAAASAMKLAISMWSGETSCSVPESLSLRSEEHTSELQSPCNLVCRLLLEKKKNEDFFPAPPCAATVEAAEDHTNAAPVVGPPGAHTLALPTRALVLPESPVLSRGGLAERL